MIEATSGLDRGCFLVGKFDDIDWMAPSALNTVEKSMVRSRGWSKDHVLVLDLQTGEGAILLPTPGASTKAKVSPMFKPFLMWLFEQSLTNIAHLPPVVELPYAVDGRS